MNRFVWICLCMTLLGCFWAAASQTFDAPDASPQRTTYFRRKMGRCRPDDLENAVSLLPANVYKREESDRGGHKERLIALNPGIITDDERAERVISRLRAERDNQENRPRRSPNQHWSTFVRNHAKAIVACDFVLGVIASSRVLYVFVALEIGSRSILRINVTDHPTAE